MCNKLWLLLVLTFGGLYAEPCSIPRKNCSKVSADRISGELRNQMSRREGARSQVSIELGNGKILNGIVSSWSPTGIAVGPQQSVPQSFAPTEIKRVSIQRKANRWKKGVVAVLLGCVGGTVGVLATSDSNAPCGLIGLGAGVAIGVLAVGRGKTDEYEVR